jgi:hypothetical protein
MQFDFTYSFISLTFKNYLLAMSHSPFNMHFQHPLFLRYLIPSAMRAFILLTN